jgi:hypothetical protein
MNNPQRVIELSDRIQKVTNDKVVRISDVTSSVRILALNALIEAKRAGDHGLGFAVVANEVKSIAATVARIADELETDLKASATELSQIGRDLVQDVRGTRLTDLAYNAIEIIDRNLYERSCDVRWWATDSAVVDACNAGSACAHASSRLGVILDSYTVYLDLFVADAKGRIIASGRPGRFPQATGADVSRTDWYRGAMSTRDGGDFHVQDISSEPLLGNAKVATYATAIRAGGAVKGRPIGALGIFFDWQTQAQAVVDGVRIPEIERPRSRVLLLDHQFRVIAASDQRGVLSERFPLKTDGKTSGYYRQGDSVIGFAKTPGYETYNGLGWYGAIIQSD